MNATIARTIAARLDAEAATVDREYARTLRATALRLRNDADAFDRYAAEAAR